MIDYAQTPHAQVHYFLHDKDIGTIVEVGARDCLGSIILATVFPKATVYSYECNPSLIEGCRRVVASAPCKDRIVFHDYGLGRKKETRPFYPYIGSDTEPSDGGPSSFLQRTDFESTQTTVDNIQLDTLANELSRYGLDRVDLLFMDVQGYELNVMLGAGDYMRQVRYILLEIPREGIDHSVYIGAPSRQTILDYLTPLGFDIVGSMYENELEENLLLVNTRLG
jgi:FkbM family methyltransferase